MQMHLTFRDAASVPSPARLAESPTHRVLRATAAPARRPGFTTSDWVAVMALLLAILASPILYDLALATGLAR